MNRQQLEIIISTCGNDIYSFCLYLTKDTLLAEELYQDIFLTAINQDKIDFAVNPKSYLLGIAVNLWRNRNRKFALRQQKVNAMHISCLETADIADEKYDVDEIVERNEIKERVRYAAVKFLSPSQVAVETGKSAVAQAFESEDAITVNETQCFKDYNVTFLGLVSGKTLGDKNILRNGEFESDRTYFVTAIEKVDGSGFEDLETSPSFCVSPFIKGHRPALVNVMTLKGHYSEILENGIIYRIMDCTNIECFADTTVYLGVTEGLLPQWSAYIQDGTTGVISRNQKFDGLNALFEIPLDKTKADPVIAAEKINTIMQ